MGGFSCEKNKGYFQQIVGKYAQNKVHVYEEVCRTRMENESGSNWEKTGNRSLWFRSDRSDCTAMPDRIHR